MPSITEQQVDMLISSVDNVRDKCIISLLADSGMRLRELAGVKASDIDSESYTIAIWGKGNKQRRAPFTETTGGLLQRWLSRNGGGDNIWGINRHGIETLLKRLKQDMGIPCNAHSFRWGFACTLHWKGLSTLDIMHLGGWQDLSMVLRYTRSINFEDCLKHYKQVAR